MRKWSLQTWAIIALGGVAVIATGAFLMQSKHAALGRQVKRNVTKFLIDNGSRIDNGVISGGMVSIPMKTSIAVNSTVVSMLNVFSDQSGGARPANPTVTSESPVITGKHSQPPRAQASSSPQARPSPRTSGHQGASAMGSGRLPSSSPDEGGFRSREDKRTSEVPEYNPEEFVNKGPRPPQDCDLFADDHNPNVGRPGNDDD